MTRAAASAWRRLRTRRRPLLAGEILVVLCLLKVYDYVRAHAEVRAGAALQHGRDLLAFEGTLRIDVERSLNHWAHRHEVVVFLASHWYQFVHIPLTLAVLAWVWVRHPGHYRRSRNALVLINVLGLAVFLLLPVAPPRLLPGGDFLDSVALAGFASNHGGPIPADQYGAMPSLHLAWAVWSAVVVRRIIGRPRWRLAWLAYPIMTTVAVVLTGNHYLLDAVAGAAVALFALSLWPTPVTTARPRTDAADAPTLVDLRSLPAGPARDEAAVGLAQARP